MEAGGSYPRAKKRKDRMLHLENGSLSSLDNAKPCYYEPVYCLLINLYARLRSFVKFALCKVFLPVPTLWLLFQTESGSLLSGHSRTKLPGNFGQTTPKPNQQPRHPEPRTHYKSERGGPWKGHASKQRVFHAQRHFLRCHPDSTKNVPETGRTCPETPLDVPLLPPRVHSENGIVSSLLSNDQEGTEIRIKTGGITSYLLQNGLRCPAALPRCFLE